MRRPVGSGRRVSHFHYRRGKCENLSLSQVCRAVFWVGNVDWTARCAMHREEEQFTGRFERCPSELGPVCVMGGDRVRCTCDDVHVPSGVI
jgi:hypothetical protein